MVTVVRPDGGAYVDFGRDVSGLLPRAPGAADPVATGDAIQVHFVGIHDQVKRQLALSQQWPLAGPERPHAPAVEEALARILPGQPVLASVDERGWAVALVDDIRPWLTRLAAVEQAFGRKVWFVEQAEVTVDTVRDALVRTVDRDLLLETSGDRITVHVAPDLRGRAINRARLLGRLLQCPIFVADAA